MTLREQDAAHATAGGHWRSDTQSISAPEQSAGHSSDAHRYENAGDGIAHSQVADRPSDGDPTLSEAAMMNVGTVLTSRAQGAARKASVHQHDTGGSNLSDQPNVVIETTHLLADPDGGLSARDPQGSVAAVASFDRAITVLNPLQAVPGRDGGHPVCDDQSSSAAVHISEPASVAVATAKKTRARGGGQGISVSQSGCAPAKKTRRAVHAATPELDMPGGGDGPSTVETRVPGAVATIVDLWRQRQQLRKAQASLGLQAQAMCRRYLNGDKEAAQKAWGLIQKGKGDADLAMIVQPYIEGAQPFERNAHLLEKQLAKLVRTLPIWIWAKDVRGLGELSVAGLVGEASGNLGDYKSVSALWKRMGLAVIGGERQRRVASAEAALLHGYAPQRRAFAYVISCNLMKSQGSEGKYRAVYDRRKAYELERQVEVKGVMEPLTKAHAHNRALRVMVKELLKDAWAADRRLRRTADEEALAA